MGGEGKWEGTGGGGVGGEEGEGALSHGPIWLKLLDLFPLRRNMVV